jgi:hypothetical protein
MREHTTNMYKIQEENYMIEGGGQFKNTRGFNQGNREGFVRGEVEQNLADEEEAP